MRTELDTTMERQRGRELTMVMNLCVVSLLFIQITGLYGNEIQLGHRLMKRETHNTSPPVHQPTPTKELADIETTKRTKSNGENN